MYSAMGGATAGIRISSPIAVFNNNQFLVPCILGAGTTLVVLIISVFWFPETLRKEAKDTRPNENDDFLSCKHLDKFSRTVASVEFSS
jgi:hypothetical protein